LAVLNWWWKR